MARVFFDVGANNGSGFVDLAANEPDALVYAFEPTPEMCEIIRSRASHLKNYRLTEKAVADFDGKATFKVAGQADWGCSSLLDFSEKSRTEWEGRTDFKVTKTIEVDVIRLDRFIEENGIEEIEHLHVDTQGCDLKVLLGLGKYISIIKSGLIEAANKEDILYSGQNTKEQCVEFLEKNGFKIDGVWCNDHMCNEVNIRFSR